MVAFLQGRISGQRDQVGRLAKSPIDCCMAEAHPAFDILDRVYVDPFPLNGAKPDLHVWAVADFKCCPVRQYLDEIQQCVTYRRATTLVLPAG